MNLGYLYHEYLVDLECSLQHSSRSIDLCRQIDNVSALYAESNLIETLAFLGELTEAEEKSALFITDSEVPETLSNYYFAIRHVQILLHKGEWETALSISRELLSELRLGGSFQRIANRNLDLVMATIELSHFKSMADLSEAEYALNENIRLGDRVVQSNFLLVEVYTHQNRLSDAFDQLSCAQDLHPPAAKDTNLFRVLRANAETELALVGGRWDEAVEASRTSIEIYKNCGHRWGSARKLIDLGDALAGRNEPGDQERARETYQQSLDMFTEMGAPGYIKVLEERLANL
jgi:tetratricopeptide (TPR) repeat protein